MYIIDGQICLESVNKELIYCNLKMYISFCEICTFRFKDYKLNPV